MGERSPNMTVNRYLKDKAMDRIDHALGRPIDPMKPTYRNYYAIDSASQLAKEMRASAHWSESNESGDMTRFHVTYEGRSALADHLKKIKEPHRLYRIEIDWDGRTVPVYKAAKSRGKAKYEAFLDISDCYSELTFAAFARTVVSVRLARP